MVDGGGPLKYFRCGLPKLNHMPVVNIRESGNFESSEPYRAYFCVIYGLNLLVDLGGLAWRQPQHPRALHCPTHL